MGKIVPLEDRFHEKYEPVTESGCWIWTASTNGRGYGRIQVNHISRFLAQAHRISWEIHNGPIPDSINGDKVCVCHRCDNTYCVNPDHLFLGTHKDNMTDKVNKGRQPRGEDIAKHGRGELNKQSRLKAHEVIKIRNLYSQTDMSHGDLSIMFGVSRPQIQRIIARKRWAHI